MKEKKAQSTKHVRSIEKLHHFSCGACNKWWSIGDAPQAPRAWYCPWCGTKAKH
ncbi:MAG TPA: hypothetical protein VJ579_02975 [Candidatus Paceibacterota bacterium]|nr:hypothetical protein [Candidatus Paceibacterota bacterium]